MAIFRSLLRVLTSIGSSITRGSVLVALSVFLSISVFVCLCLCALLYISAFVL